MKSKHMILRLFSSGFLAAILVWAGACGRKKATSEWESFAQHVVETYVNQTVSLPDSLPVEHPEIIDGIYRAPLKIVVVVDLDCSTCLLKFNYWNDFTKRLYDRQGIHIPLLFYINTGRPDGLAERMADFTAHAWAYDSEQLFNAANGLYDPQFQALLLDAEDRIILIGNPMDNPKLEALYEKTIVARNHSLQTVK